jgi:hypothetical protein
LINIKSVVRSRQASFSKYSFIKRASALAFCFLFVTACDDPAPPERSGTSAPARPEVFTVAGRSWLDVKDNVSPAVWLASREAGRDVDPNDPAAASLRALLDEADARFTESPRMIANRAVQVQSMLAERGVMESAREVIAGLVSIGQVGERAGFGETCQHYVNARAASGSRMAALETLRRQPLPPPSGSEER